LAYRRLAKLVRASKSVSITFHTFKRAEHFPFWPTVKHFIRGRWGSMIKDLVEWRHDRWIGGKVFSLIRSQMKRKPVSIIVHTSREAEYLKLEHGFSNVFDHPLAFLTEADVAEAQTVSNRSAFPQLAGLPREAKLVGVFGFISPYKGTATAIRALRCLPDDYHLVIFGGIHPNEIKPHVEINSYLDRVLEEMSGLETESAAVDGAPAAAPTAFSRKHLDVSGRVHFMGSLNDDDFVRGMCLCHSTVFPYLEVGQTSSGPISIAIELGCRVFAARNHAFMQLAKYHPGRFEFFDIGNHHELADRILHPQVTKSAEPKISYRSNIKVYAAAHADAVAKS
jgi:glycosyltransferase involved in cell wall biosynthesis